MQIQPWNGFFLWKYLPSLPAGAVFAALFTIATAAVIFRSAQSKTLYSIPFIIAGICTSFPLFSNSLQVNVDHH